MGLQSNPSEAPDEFGLETMQSGQLEQVLIDLLTAKFPGIERADIDRFFRALDSGRLDQVAQIEADMAYKSAQWKLAARDLDA